VGFWEGVWGHTLWNTENSTETGLDHWVGLEMGTKKAMLLVSIAA
jgi:hypothetical protein